MELTLKLTIEELKTIGAGLSELPYKIAAPLVDKLQQQIDAQTIIPAEHMEAEPDENIEEDISL